MIYTGQIFDGGSYNPHTDIGGVAGQDGKQAVSGDRYIDCTFKNWRVGLRMNNCTDVVADGCMFDNCGYPMFINGGGPGVIIRGGYAKGGLQGPRFEGGAHDFVVEDFESSYMKEDNYAVMPSDAEGDGASTHESTYNGTFRRCNFHHNYDGGFDIKGNGHKLIDCISQYNQGGNFKFFHLNWELRNSLSSNGVKYSNGNGGDGIFIANNSKGIMSSVTTKDNGGTDMFMLSGSFAIIDNSIIMSPRNPLFISFTSSYIKGTAEPVIDPSWGYQTPVTTPPVTPPTPTLKGINIVDGYYRVIVNGIEISKHSEYVQAIESATNQLLANPDANVNLTFDGGKVVRK